MSERVADTFPSLKRRGGCGINKKARSLRSAADGVVSSAKLFKPKDFADLFLRLRPIGLAHNGGTVRLVMLPDEAHGYAARETIEHVLYEMVSWMERFAKDVQ